MITTSGSFHWNELLTRDVEKAKAFYAAVCGWTYQDMEVDGMNYTVAMVGEQPVGGIYLMSGEHFDGVPEYWAASCRQV